MVGLLAAALVHLVVGSPGGRPTSSRIELALRELGVDVADLAAAPGHDAGVVRFAGHDVDGPIDVKVYGRDAWDAQLLTTLWRLAWYRGGQRTARLTRIELVEHEGFVTLLAERSGVRVPRLVTAGSAGQGDALVVVRPDGRPLESGRRTRRRRRETLTDDALDSLWRQLGRLHDAGIAHHRIDLDRVVRHDDGDARLRRPVVGRRRRDSRPTAARTRPRRSPSCWPSPARSAPWPAPGAGSATTGSSQALRYLQEAALPNGVRDALAAAHLDVDKVRNRVRVALGADEQQLIKLRRVTAGSLLNLALLGVAAYALIAAFSGMDLAVLPRRAARRQLVVAGLRPRAVPGRTRRGRHQHHRIGGARRCRSDRSPRCSSPSATSTWRSPARRHASPSTCGSSSASACRRRRR